ncbi:unnamed protein product [Pleuronectes platessa]|uniref:Tripartite motif-containing protein 54 n=1 Tax=Pleuronectes platessa TaxID=8262 RepID=A0A9N7VYE0_PLEPL|nr:unnamed protein product [Pleuronectes platessa]
MNFAPGFRPPPAGRSGPGAGGGATMENLEKQLICPVCLEMFSKPVVILPCQHNLCRKCANDIFHSANPLWQSRGSSSIAASGGRFRCPSCRHEVVLDRHGVFGLQRNLLVENIIDIYRQQESSRPVNMKPEQQQQLMCDDHEEEKINIYCVSCETPTCSMCKVFGRHKDCDVAPLGSVYMRQKVTVRRRHRGKPRDSGGDPVGAVEGSWQLPEESHTLATEAGACLKVKGRSQNIFNSPNSKKYTELSDGIAILVASNDNIQAAISQLEDICHTVEESGRRQREQLAAHFSGLVSVLEERKQELVGHISREQDGKLKHLRGLIRRHSDHQEAAVTLVESGIQAMEEPHMAVFIQSATVLLEKMAVTARASNVERPELGFESMSHFSIDTDHLTEMLHNMDFCSGVGDEEDSEDVGEESEPDFGCRY